MQIKNVNLQSECDNLKLSVSIIEDKYQTLQSEKEMDSICQSELQNSLNKLQEASEDVKKTLEIERDY